MTIVLVDATALPADRGGVGRYVDELVSRLPALGITTHVAAAARDTERFAQWVGRDQVHPAPVWAARTPVRLGWEQVGLPSTARRVGADVVHSPHYTMPLLLALPRGPAQVVTLHDATFFSLPQTHLPAKRRFFGAWTRVSVRLADRLVVPSRATLEQVREHVGGAPEQFTVVPHGVDHEHFRPPTPAQVATVRARLGLAEGTSYVAFLGTLEPRKNVPALIDAWVQVCRDRPEPPALVVAGGRGWDDEVEPALARVPGHLTVLRPGFVPDDLVPALLGGAQVVAYPTLGEGFGLPVLEAMACGAAVLTTRELSLPEVGGDAVAYAASPDTPDLAAALAALLDDPDRRERLRVDALARAATFTWEATAAAHAQVFTEVARGRRPA
ncbi:MAG: glycosyltransferase family 4 protein [Actinomycetota bacterium]|nr:glycosyltransferase family 4 protein [Actinomycetota bacterium]